MAGAASRLLEILALLRVPQAMLALSRPQVRILMYHGVSAGRPARAPFQGRGKHVPREEFARQMSWLARHMRPVGLAEICARLSAGRRLPRRGVAVTLDDGYRNNLLHAAPVLGELGMPATVYVTTSLVEGHPLWVDRLDAALEAAPRGSLRLRLGGRVHEETWDGPEQGRAVCDRLRRAGKGLAGAERRSFVDDVARQLVHDLAALPGHERPEDTQALAPRDLPRLRAAGMDVGAHTVSHESLARCPDDLLRHELVASRERLEEWSGGPVLDFAYPNGGPGDFDARTREAVRQAGYRSAVTTVRGPVTATADPLALRRLPVSADEPFAGFLADLAGLRRLLLAARSRSRRVVRGAGDGRSPSPA